MRTTIDIDADVLEIARNFADDSNISLGKAVSELARKGASAELPIRTRSRFPVFDIPRAGRSFGLEDVKSAEQGDDLEYRKFFAGKSE